MSPGRSRPGRVVTRTGLCVRCVLCPPAFLSVPALGSTGSAAGEPALFVGFAATMAECDFSQSCIIGYGSSPSRYGPEQHATYVAVGRPCGDSPANTTIGRRARTAAGSAVITWVRPGPHVTEATAILP